MPYRRFVLGICTAAVACVMAACACHGTRGADDYASPYVVGLSTGGGFSGMHTGAVIDARGVVTRWEGLYGKKDAVRPAGRLHTDELRALTSLIDSAGIFDLRLADTGNMTTTLTIERGERVYTWSWPGTESDPDTVPAPLRPLVERLRSTLAAHTQQN